ncbi:hypothetical protein HDG34_003274 [Paraburkholderia sp. HC6.4b]|uniref:hypothetical protein n=1 Tax=unclassified Paraburkholderia TaxID=2615204 RepID=UPI00161C0FDE|nr:MULTISPECIES: hypothetical protein [unclassified Paraburkholderia]MBB5409333.1 hypothetical protein [Paraburkholderia sp. HC6.4b]MBB5451061.1 hypothetical protein [Paraburkholderia sp. Kb1A]
MKAIVLDTRPLVNEYREYEPFFAFYENGIRDLLKEAVLIHSTSSPFSTTWHPKGLVGKVEADFDYALDCYRDSCEETAMPLFDERFLFSNLDVIRFAAQSMEDAVEKLFRLHLPTRFFEIADEHQGQAFSPRWIGSDLLVHVRLLS